MSQLNTEISQFFDKSFLYRFLQTKETDIARAPGLIKLQIKKEVREITIFQQVVNFAQNQTDTSSLLNYKF